jgi:hypothetical protein
MLEYRVFTAKRPGLTPGVPSGHESLLWVANSATLIYGEREAVLVDTFLTIDQSDHWFGQHLFIGETDTVTDIADGFLGAAIGGLFLAFWAMARYTSHRLPARVQKRVLA